MHIRIDKKKNKLDKKTGGGMRELKDGCEECQPHLAVKIDKLVMNKVSNGVR